jgi:hypothetical protein
MTTYMDPQRAALADACKSLPGRWFKVPEGYYKHLKDGALQFGSAIRRGQSPAFRPKGSFDAIKDRNGELFIQYKGP